MKVLFISHDSGLYGATKSLLDLIIQLMKINVEPYIVLPSKGSLEKELRKNNIQYIIIPYHICFCKKSEKNPIKGISDYIFNISAIKKIVQFINLKRIDLIHSNIAESDVGAIAALITGKPHIWHFREFIKESNMEFQFNFIMKYFINHSYCTIAISQSIRKSYQKIYKKAKYITLWNGVDINKYCINKDKYFLNNTVNLIICGAIYESKGQIDAIKALALLINKGYNNLKLTIVGNGDGIYINYLKKYINKNNLQDYVFFTGFKEDISELRKNADIALVCSKNEAFGRVTIESMLAENLVIGANTAGTKELIGNNLYGFLYKQGDPEDLSYVVEYALQNKEECIEKLKKAKNFSLSNFSSQNYAIKIKSIYEHALINVSPINIKF